jgi:hypothetical protein
MGVTCGPGHPFIRLQALGSGPVSTAVPNAVYPLRLPLVDTSP